MPQLHSDVFVMEQRRQVKASCGSRQLLIKVMSGPYTITSGAGKDFYMHIYYPNFLQNNNNNNKNNNKINGFIVESIKMALPLQFTKNFQNHILK